MTSEKKEGLATLKDSCQVDACRTWGGGRKSKSKRPLGRKTRLGQGRRVHEQVGMKLMVRKWTAKI